jgi:arsenate reductase
MAEGLLRSIYGEEYEVFSAGTNPTKVNPLAVIAMAELGIDISKQYSKGLEEFSDKEIDLAISVCQSSSKTLCTLCSAPTTMGRPLIVNAKLHKTKKYFVRSFADPSEVEGAYEERLAAFRKVRDELKTWVTTYFADVKIVSENNNMLN